jgi:hypothetical protein
MIPAGSMPTPGRPDLVAQQLERLAHRASMICETSSRLTVRPASSPRTETLICSSSSIRDRSHVPWLILSSSATWMLVLRPIATSVGDVGATDRQHPGVERRAVWKRARSIVPAPMSATATPSSFSVSDRTASADASESTTSSSILTPAAADALGQVLDRGRRRRDDVGLDLEPQRAHPERVLDALLAVDR